MSESIEMTLGVALVLDEVARKILYAIKEENGEKVIVDRELPFRLRYRLNKNKMILDKDVEWFNQQKLIALAKYGEPTEDNTSVAIKDPEKMEKYKEEIGRLIDLKINHEFVELEPQDIEMIEDPDITVSPDAMTLFIGYLTNDPELDKELSFEINLREYPNKEVVNTEDVKKESVKVEEVKQVVEEVPVASKKKVSKKAKAEVNSESTEEVKSVKKAAKKSTKKKD